MRNIPAYLPLLLTVGLVFLGHILRPESRRRWWTVSLVTLASSIVDAGLLIALPLLHLSFGKVAFSLIALNLIRLAVLLSGLLMLSFFRSRPNVLRVTTVMVVVLQVILLALAVDGLYIEPFRLTVTEVRQEAPAFFPDRPLRIVQLSDLHVERITIRERAMIERVNALRPDIIVLTGDYINEEYLDDPLAVEAARTVLSQLSAPYGVYAVAGSTDTSKIMRTLFNGSNNIHMLWNHVEAVSLPGGTLYLVGISIDADTDLDRAKLIGLMDEVPAGAYSVLLYHTPDLIETAAEHNVSLYFAGHTHGGQVRLPFYGAMITFSEYGKKYEMGEYHVGPTKLYVSRGLGMEGLGLPRVRFLCPPEIVVFDLNP